MTEELHLPKPHLPTILVVDDNKSFVDNMLEILDAAGYQARGSSCCRDALISTAEGFDVALVDLKLPDGDGTTLAPLLKDHNPDAEVVVLTGYGTVETAAAAVRAGAFAYLVKPCSTSELLLTIEQALRQVKLHVEKRDLARRAQMAEKLAAVGTLTAGLSHEIRNPLNAAGLQLTVLERRIARLPEETSVPLMEPLTLVRDEIRRLDHILEDFLQFARPRELIAKPVNLIVLVGKVLDLIQGDADRRNIQIDRNFAPVPSVAGDDGRLRQVVMNLALNAMEAIHGSGRILFSTTVKDRQVELSIEDSGPGIPPEDRHRLFEPFFTTKASGSGLGLAIVNAIVTQHGGTISIEEAALGGARFAVRLPMAG